MGYIYKTVNKINGKFYVGMSKFDPEENPNYLGSGFLIRKAIKKYGKHQFEKIILEVSNTKRGLCSAERRWIKKTKANHRNVGYNICEGGEWGDNWTHNPNKEKIRKEISIRTKGNKNPNFGHYWTQKQKSHMSQSAIKRKAWLDKKTGKNYAQLPAVRKKLSQTKMGILNPHASKWKLISPDGKEFTINGGIKREIKQYGVDYQTFNIICDNGNRKNRSGWTLIKIMKGD